MATMWLSVTVLAIATLWIAIGHVFLLRRVAMLVPPDVASRVRWPITGLHPGDVPPPSFSAASELHDGIVVLLEGTPFDFGAVASAYAVGQDLGRAVVVLYDDGQRPGDTRWLQQFAQHCDVTIIPVSAAAFRDLGLLASPVTLAVRDGRVAAASFRLTNPVEVREHVGIHLQGQIRFGPLEESTR